MPMACTGCLNHAQIASAKRSSHGFAENRDSTASAAISALAHQEGFVGNASECAAKHGADPVDIVRIPKANGDDDLLTEQGETHERGDGGAGELGNPVTDSTLEIDLPAHERTEGDSGIE